MKKISGVYRIKSSIDGKIYIGSSVDVYKRFNSHKELLRKNKHYNAHLQRAWNLYGEENFIFEILIETDKDSLLDLEQEFIDSTNCYDESIGYNFGCASAPMKGRKHTADALSKMSKSHIGLKHKKESIEKIRLSHAGKKFTREHVEAMSRCRIGKPMKASTRDKLIEVRNTEAWKKRQSASQKKRDFSYLRSPEIIEKSANTRRKAFIIHSPEGQVFEVIGLARFCREHNLDQGSMSSVAHGKYKSYKGWTCKRIESCLTP